MDRRGELKSEKIRPSGNLTVFASYASKDRSRVKSILRRLVQAGIPIWLDKSQLAPGDIWIEKIQAALPRSLVVLVFIGPGGLGDFQKWEVSAALKRASQGHLTLIPVLLSGVTDADIPTFLEAIESIDYRNNSRAFKKLLTGIRCALGLDESSLD